MGDPITVSSFRHLFFKDPEKYIYPYIHGRYPFRILCICKRSYRTASKVKTTTENAPKDSINPKFVHSQSYNLLIITRLLLHLVLHNEPVKYEYVGKTKQTDCRILHFEYPVILNLEIDYDDYVTSTVYVSNVLTYMFLQICFKKLSVELWLTSENAKTTGLPTSNWHIWLETFNLYFDWSICISM